MLGGVADITRTTTSAVVSQYNVQPVVQIYAAAQSRDLGALATDVQKLHSDTVSKGDRRKQAEEQPTVGLVHGPHLAEQDNVAALRHRSKANAENTQLKQ